MLLMFRLPNADVCWVAVWRAKRYLASELRKQLNVVDNWSWCGIHSSLSEAGLSPSRGGWTAHMCVKVRLSSNLWPYIETASLICHEKRVFTQQKEKSCLHKEGISIVMDTSAGCWRIRHWEIVRYFTFIFELNVNVSTALTQMLQIIHF